MQRGPFMFGLGHALVSPNENAHQLTVIDLSTMAITRTLTFLSPTPRSLRTHRTPA